VTGRDVKYSDEGTIHQFLSTEGLESIVRLALDEDHAWEDVTTQALVDPAATCKAHFVAQEDVVVAGAPVAEVVFALLDDGVEFKPMADEGAVLGDGETIAEIRGRAAALLAGERTALNFVQRLSGIATAAHQFSKLVEGTAARIYDTRKTTPGLRLLEKYAVYIGGGCNHRMNLAERVLIKDNHLALFGRKNIRAAVEETRRVCGPDMKIEVEIEDMDGFKQALESSADTIMLDNMSVEEIAAAVALADETLGPDRPKLEASGNVRKDDVRAIAATGVDRISIGWLTHSKRAANVSMEITL